MRVSIFESDNTFGEDSHAAGSAGGVIDLGGTAHWLTGGSDVSVSGGAVGQVQKVPARDVTILVSGQPLSLAGVLVPPLGVYQVSGVAGQIQAALIQKNWSILSITNTSEQPVYQSFRIVASVESQYDYQTIVRNIRNDLGGILSNMTVAIEKEGPVVFVDPNTRKPGNGGFDLNSILENFAKGLGVSTPVALLGGAVILILILKR